MLGCGDNPECAAFDFAPPAAVLSLRGPDGKKICDLSAQCGDEPVSTCLKLELTDESATQATLKPEERELGFNNSLSVVQYEEYCEYRAGGWYDRDAALAVEARIRFTGKDIAYASEAFEFEFEDDACGLPRAAARVVRLIAVPVVREE